MSNLVKLAYQPGEAPQEESSPTPLSAGSTDRNKESTPGTETTLTSSGTEETTESEESEEEQSSTEEESPVVTRRSPVPLLKANPADTGSPELTQGGGSIYVDAVEEQELGSLAKTISAMKTDIKASQNTSESGTKIRSTSKSANRGSISTQTPQGINISKRSRSKQNADTSAGAEQKNSKNPEQVSQEKSISSLKIINRVFKLPVVQSALFVYDNAKELPCVGLAINMAEIGAYLAMAPAVFFGTPFVNMCSSPIDGVDHVLCLGMDVAEKVFPCLQMTPSQIVGSAVNGTINCVCCFPRTVYAVCEKCGLVRKEKLN